MTCNNCLFLEKRYTKLISMIILRLNDLKEKEMSVEARNKLQEIINSIVNGS